MLAWARTTQTATFSLRAPSPHERVADTNDNQKHVLSPDRTAAVDCQPQTSKFTVQSFVQARISATKGGGKAPAGGKPATTSATPSAEKLGAIQTQPLFEPVSARPAAAGLSTPFAAPVEAGGLFSNSRSFLDGEIGGDTARAGEDDDAAAWLEREKEQREQRERARREEEER